MFVVSTRRMWGGGGGALVLLPLKDMRIVSYSALQLPLSHYRFQNIDRMSETRIPVGHGKTRDYVGVPKQLYSEDVSGTRTCGGEPVSHSPGRCLFDGRVFPSRKEVIRGSDVR